MGAEGELDPIVDEGMVMDTYEGAPEVEPAHINTVARSRKQWKITGAIEQGPDEGDFLREDSAEAVRDRTD